MKESVAHPVSVKRFADGRGELGVIDLAHDLPFEAKRVFFIDGFSRGTVRGGHAHKVTEEVIVVLQGQMRIELESKTGRQQYSLRKNGDALFVPAKHWIMLESLADETLCLVIASTPYSDDDYIRDKNDFMQMIQA